MISSLGFDVILRSRFYGCAPYFFIKGGSSPCSSYEQCMCQSIAALLVASICARSRHAILGNKFMLRARCAKLREAALALKEGCHRSAAWRACGGCAQEGFATGNTLRFRRN